MIEASDRATSTARLTTVLTAASAAVAIAAAVVALAITWSSSQLTPVLLLAAILVAALAAAAVAQQRRGAALARAPETHVLASGDEAQAASFSRARFIAEMGHDLRQPLHALGLFLDALERRVTPGEGEKILGRARQAADAMGRAFNALIDLVRIEADALLPEVERFAVDDFLIKLGEQGAEPAASAGVDIRVVHAHGDVIGDSRLVAYIARILLTNLIDLGASQVLLGARRRANVLWLELHCARSGELGRKWETLRPAPVWAPGNVNALELDLFVARRLAEVMGVELRVGAKPDRGIVLALGLPAAGENPALPLRGRSILLVADNASRRTTPELALARAGAVVHVAGNLRQAECAKRIGKVDLLVTELAVADAALRERLSPDTPTLPNRTPAETIVAAAVAALASKA